MLGALLEKMMTEGIHMFDDNEKISAIVEIRAKAGHEEEVRVILHELVVPTRAQAGCELYYLLENKKYPGSFSTYEEWSGVKALEAHLASEAAKAALAKAQAVLDGEMKLTVFRKLL